MTTHRYSTFLTASFGMLMFANAHAVGLSMDSGSKTASETSASASDADCPQPAITRAIQSSVRMSPSSGSASAQISDMRAAPASRAAVAPESENADTSSPSGSSTSSVNTLITPSKLRGNRWQSLVPGAIK